MKMKFVFNNTQGATRTGALGNASRRGPEAARRSRDATRNIPRTPPTVPGTRVLGSAPRGAIGRRVAWIG
jgi:hypothetical protein